MGHFPLTHTKACVPVYAHKHYLNKCAAHLDTCLRVQHPADAEGHRLCDNVGKHGIPVWKVSFYQKQSFNQYIQSQYRKKFKKQVIQIMFLILHKHLQHVCSLETSVSSQNSFSFLSSIFSTCCVTE